MSGHTTGPWVISNNGNPIFGSFTIRQNPDDWDGMGYQHICSVPSAPKDSPTGQMFRANANLIAAAPDLLAALKNAERVQENVIENLTDLYNSGKLEDLWGLEVAERVLQATRAAIAKAEGRDIEGIG